MTDHRFDFTKRLFECLVGETPREVEISQAAMPIGLGDGCGDMIQGRHDIGCGVGYDRFGLDQSPAVQEQAIEELAGAWVTPLRSLP